MTDKKRNVTTWEQQHALEEIERHLETDFRDTRMPERGNNSQTRRSRGESVSLRFIPKNKMNNTKLTPQETQYLKWRILYACQVGNDWSVKELFSTAKSDILRAEIKRIYSAIRICTDGTHYLYRHSIEAERISR